MWLVGAPLRARAAGGRGRRRRSSASALEAARDAKYREIRELELDHRTGKLSDEDFRALDRQLRAEAVEILRAARRARQLDCAPMLENILSVVQVVLSFVVIFLVLLHSGKDAGLSGAFGVGTGSGPFGGGSLVERNLNRWTVFFAVLWAVNCIVLIKI